MGVFRDFLQQNGATPEEQELIAAKLMGRWRSGAPLVLAPDKDDPKLASDPTATTTLITGKWTHTDMRFHSGRTSGA